MKENDYLLLLYKRLNAEIGPEESARLEAWLLESAEHRRLAGEMEQIWAATGAYTPSLNVDLDKDFSLLQSRLRQEEATPKIKIVRFPTVLVRIAAALLLLLSAVWVFRVLQPEKPVWQMAAAGNAPKIEVTLPDGTRVWLRQGSSLEYPTSFEGAHRLVNLRGEAYFDVAHDPAHPFRVSVNTGEKVEVLGTQFNVRASDQAQTSVLVRSGKVRYTPVDSQEGVLLVAGKKAVYDKITAKITLSDAISYNELAWQTGGLEFVKTPLSQAVRDLENWYGVKVSLENPALANCPHTAPLTNQSIDVVLKAMAETYGMNVRRDSEGNYHLSGGNCQ